MEAWKLPLVVAAITVPIIAAFLVGGPGLGAAVGALAAVAIVWLAARRQPRTGLGRRPSPELAGRLLVVVSRPVEDPAAIAQIAAAAHDAEGAAQDKDVLVLAPARIGFLDRWASDVEAARRAAQHNLVITVASLAKAGISAEARVGDEDLVQAVEDTLGEFAATEVILVTGDDADDPHAARGAAELGARLRTGYRRLVLAGGE